MSFAGVYTGKFTVGQKVHTKDTYPTGTYKGVILSILSGQEFNNAYGVNLENEKHDDQSPVITYLSETDIEEVN